MYKLIAKSQKDGRYYYCDASGAVYLVSCPFRESDVEYVDELPVFYRKSADTNLDFEEKEFECFADLVNYAVGERSLEARGAKLSPAEPVDDLLMYAPVEIVKGYFTLIKELITANKLVGIDFYFNQLTRNIIIRNDDMLFCELVGLRNAYYNMLGKSQFAGIREHDKVDKALIRISNSKNVLENKVT